MFFQSDYKSSRIIYRACDYLSSTFGEGTCTEVTLSARSEREHYSLALQASVSHGNHPNKVFQDIVVCKWFCLWCTLFAMNSIIILYHMQNNILVLSILHNSMNKNRLMIYPDYSIYMFLLLSDLTHAW